MLPLILLVATQLVAATPGDHDAGDKVRRQAVATTNDNLLNILVTPEPVDIPLVPAGDLIPLVTPEPVDIPLVPAGDLIPLVTTEEASPTANTPPSPTSEVEQLCDQETGPLVTSCNFTPDEWARFGIDDFLAQAISVNGPERSFPFGELLP